jgi:citrate synthase
LIFVSRKLYPNVDFYSGIIYRGIPMIYSYVCYWAFTGWIAQWKERNKEPIGRPRQIYTGHL